MKKLLCIIIAIAGISCNDGKTHSDKVENTSEHQKETSTSLDWKQINGNFYSDKDGNIGYKVPVDSLEREKTGYNYRYLTHVYGVNDEPVELGKVVDIASLKDLDYGFYQDKNHIYYHYEMADGGTFSIFEADLKTFEVLNYFYSRDKNHVYEYRNGIMEGVDPKTFKVYNGSACFGKDKNGYYNWNTKIYKDSIKDPSILEILNKLDEL